MRALVISSVKFTFADHEDLTAEGHTFDDLLKPLIPQFMSLVAQDQDLAVKRVILTTLDTALHNKPQLLRDSLSVLLPLVYEETTLRESLIHVIDMGPFKHKVLSLPFVQFLIAY